MSEYQAWLYLAELWDDAKPNEYGDHSIIIFDKAVNCLCNSLKYLYFEGKINPTLYLYMWNVIKRVPRLALSEYCWPKDAAGAKSRAKFCRDMAERIVSDTENK